MTRKTKKPLLRAALLAVALLLALTACGQPATEPSSSTSESAGGLGETAVKAIALAHAQLAEDQTEELKTARRMENGLLQYDVSFTSGGVRYLYVIDGASGAILSNQTDTPSPSSATGQGDIGETAAKAVALAHAGFREEEVTGLRVRQDYDDGRLEYDVDFWQGSSEHEYTIDGVTGEVLEYEGERHGAGHGGGTGDIGAEGAKAAALAHAGLKEKDVTGLTVDRDYDDGRLEYDVDFWQGSTEYEYTIDGATGAVLECQQDRH